MLTRYSHNFTFLHKNDHDWKKYNLQEQMQYKASLKCIKIDVSASICSNFNSYLTVT